MQRLKFIVQSAGRGRHVGLLGSESSSSPYRSAMASLSSVALLPLTVLWFVGVINALNLIDGLDGLASGIALFAVLVLFGVSYFDHAVLLSLLSIALAGALVGFLFFNFNPAKIFLGDSGSMFIGFAPGCDLYFGHSARCDSRCACGSSLGARCTHSGCYALRCSSPESRNQSLSAPTEKARASSIAGTRP